MFAESIKRELNEKPEETSKGTKKANFRKRLKWNPTKTALPAIQLKPKSFVKAKQCFVSAKSAG